MDTIKKSKMQAMNQEKNTCNICISKGTVCRIQHFTKDGKAMASELHTKTFNIISHHENAIMQ